jgi:hypothetical protein
VRIDDATSSFQPLEAVMQRHNSFDRLTLPGYRGFAALGKRSVPARTIGEAAALDRIDNGLSKGTVDIPV